MIVLRHDGAALFQHRDERPGLRHSGKWVPPGGHAELGEELIDCARRELREETGYEARDIRYLTSIEDASAGSDRYWLSAYWCRYDATQELTCNEGQELAFIERASADAYEIPPSLICLWDAARSAAAGDPRP